MRIILSRTKQAEATNEDDIKKFIKPTSCYWLSSAEFIRGMLLCIWGFGNFHATKACW